MECGFRASHGAEKEAVIKLLGEILAENRERMKWYGFEKMIADYEPFFEALGLLSVGRWKDIIPTKQV